MRGGVGWTCWLAVCWDTCYTPGCHSQDTHLSVSVCVCVWWEVRECALCRQACGPRCGVGRVRLLSCGRVARTICAQP